MDTLTIAPDRLALSDHELNDLHRSEARTIIDRFDDPWAKECVRLLSAQGELHRQEWIARTERRIKTEPKTDAVTGEVIPPKEYFCGECGTQMFREPGTRGRMAALCVECRAKADEARAERVAEPRVCAECSTEFVPAGRGSALVKRCPTCRGLTSQPEGDKVLA